LCKVQNQDPLSPNNRERERHKTGGRTEGGGKGTPAWSESKPSGRESARTLVMESTRKVLLVDKDVVDWIREQIFRLGGCGRAHYY
jgi:hypothetical protein